MCKYLDDLMAKVRLKNTQSQEPVSEKIIMQAAKFMFDHHHKQMRLSGEPYYTHPIAVASKVMDYHFTDDIICTALLHDTVEDNKIATINKICLLFNSKVGAMVDAVSKIESKQNSCKLSSNETIIKLLSPEYTHEVILVKLADRIHNLSTIQSMPEHKKLRIANDTLKTYIPLAKYIGIKTIEKELMKLIKPIITKSLDEPVARKFHLEQHSFIYPRALSNI